MFRITQQDTALLRRRLVEFLVVFVAYYVAGKLGQATEHIRSTSIGPVWPAYGVALGAVLLCGPRIWPALAAAAFVVAYQNPVPLGAVTVQAIGATLAALAGGAMLHRVKFDGTFSRLRDALNFLVLGAAGSAMISATLGVAALYATGQQPYAGIVPAWLIYWLGDGTGVLLVTPLLLTFSDLAKFGTPARIGECVALFAALLIACLLGFGDEPLLGVRLHLVSLTVMVILWAAIRFGTVGVALATPPIAAAATIATALGYGQFAHQESAFGSAVMLDAYFVVLAVTGLMLAAVVSERAYIQAQHERLIVEQAGIAARLRLAAIVDSSEDAIIGLKLDGAVTDWNAGAAALYGRSAAEAMGHYFLQLVEPDSVGLIGEPEVVTRRDAVHRRKDGAKVPVSLTVSPIRDGAGTLVGESVIVRDVSERLRVVALRDELAHLGRVSMISALTGALAHEINQPLTAVGVNAETATLLLRRDPVPVVALREALHDIRNDNRRAGEVLMRVRNMLRREVEHLEAVDLNVIVGDVVKLIHTSAERRGIRIALSMAPDGTFVRGDRVQVQQVVLNLLMNACDAVQDNEPQFRRVSLRTLWDATGVTVRVSDTGSGKGLSDEDLARIFEPFYTTKHEGLGLGLSICSAIVAAHGGTLEATRNADRGLTFSVAFPIWPEPAREAAR